jgi:hypothetical protein
MKEHPVRNQHAAREAGGPARRPWARQTRKKAAVIYQPPIPEHHSSVGDGNAANIKMLGALHSPACRGPHSHASRTHGTPKESPLPTLSIAPSLVTPMRRLPEQRRTKPGVDAKTQQRKKKRRACTYLRLLLVNAAPKPRLAALLRASPWRALRRGCQRPKAPQHRGEKKRGKTNRKRRKTRSREAEEEEEKEHVHKRIK